MDCVAMDEDCEEEKLKNSRGKNLQSIHWKDHKIISEKEFWMESSMEQEAKLLMERARDCNWRKDLFWIENDLTETETAGKHVLEDLIKSFMLEEVNEVYVRMQEETREVRLKQFIPHLCPLYLKQEGLGLSETPEVAEWDAKEIYLNNNHLSKLPEKPNYPSLLTLFLQENYDLMEIPSSFFECCELLMVLPPEIGALLKLQVLDLEGTEIMYRPREISGLTKLECLKVSLYGYGKSYREGKQICKRIPAGLLASLYMLKALSIDVNLDDDEWIADVKDVIDELLKLELLMRLKLYLPEVGLLKEITSV
ncbi:Disease resistance protein RFL1 [Camellia lanceoleosa]|uniref:Disease resistance protein RFL1 n=1 Tax=Camellia lanceoleosa TaxID=1840588 RepID=A0ACC0GV61_9ERIC|nr:Disease resistance protein RFL1 [Camellia lanceoleosa]